MIQEIEPRKYFNQYHPDEPREEDFVFLFEDGHVYLKKGENYTIPSFGEMKSEVDKQDFIYYCYSSCMFKYRKGTYSKIFVITT